MQSELLPTTIRSVTACIDWISATRLIDRDGKADLNNVVYNRFADDEWTETRATNGYTLAWRNDIGIVQMVNPYRKDMGTHVMYTGKVLRKIEEITKVKALDILDYHIRNSDNLTRVDIAIDCYNTGMNIDALAMDWKARNVKTRARTGFRIEDLDGKGTTLYIGSRTKRKKLLRIYDKAAEQKIDGDWIRIELQVMGEPILDMVKLMESGKDDFANIVRSIIKGYCDFNQNSVWNEVFTSDSISISSQKVTKGDTREWIFNQCVPAIVRECRIDATFWEQLQLAFIAEMNEG